MKEILCPVPDNERFCEWCNAEMELMTTTMIREEIRITPAVVERVRYMQEVLICPKCKEDHDESFKYGTVPKALIEHSPASVSAVAYVMFSNAFMGLPFYRIESAFEQFVSGFREKHRLAGVSKPQMHICVLFMKDYTKN